MKKIVLVLIVVLAGGVITGCDMVKTYLPSVYNFVRELPFVNLPPIIPSPAKAQTQPKIQDEEPGVQEEEPLFLDGADL